MMILLDITHYKSYIRFLAENCEAFIAMIILITGASHTGKTMLAQKMLEKYEYP